MEDMDYGSTSSSGPGIFPMLIALAIMVFIIASMWRVFTKAGRPGWAAIVPVYNGWVLAEIGGKPGWWGLVAVLVGVIPILGAIASMVMMILISLGVANNFGKGAGFGIGLALLSPVIYPILAFSDAQYSGSAQRA